MNVMEYGLLRTRLQTDKHFQYYSHLLKLLSRHGRFTIFTI